MEKSGYLSQCWQRLQLSIKQAVHLRESKQLPQQPIHGWWGNLCLLLIAGFLLSIYPVLMLEDTPI